MKLDIGSGGYCRGDVCIDINPSGTNPNYNPKPFDFISPKSELYDYVIADANFNLPFRDGAFYTVTLIHVIEHLKCPYFTLSEVKRVVKDIGVVHVVVPNSYKNQADKYDRTHIYSFTPYSIESLMRLLFGYVLVMLIQSELDIYVIARKSPLTLDKLRRSSNA